MLTTLLIALIVILAIVFISYRKKEEQQIVSQIEQPIVKQQPPVRQPLEDVPTIDRYNEALIESRPAANKQKPKKKYYKSNANKKNANIKQKKQ